MIQVFDELFGHTTNLKKCAVGSIGTQLQDHLSAHPDQAIQDIPKFEIGKVAGEATALKNPETNTYAKARMQKTFASISPIITAPVSQRAKAIAFRGKSMAMAFHGNLWLRLTAASLDKLTAKNLNTNWGYDAKNVMQ